MKYPYICDIKKTDYETTEIMTMDMFLPLCSHHPYGTKQGENYCRKGNAVH